jgi:hypothetical protein
MASIFWGLAVPMPALHPLRALPLYVDSMPRATPALVTK